MKQDNLILQAEGEFSFQFYIEKAIPMEDSGDRMIIKGVASTINIDHDQERMSSEAIGSMASVINTKSVPLMLEHARETDAVMGNVYKAWIDERNQLWIEADMDKNNPISKYIYDGMKSGKKYGFSVGGNVKKAIREFSEKTGKIVKTFYDVVLKEVSITQRPANFDSYCFAKSLVGESENADSFRGTDFYKEFLFENRNLDYVHSFAKSIPDKSWKKVTKEINNNNNEDINKMDPKDEKKEEKAVETETETKEKAQETDTKEEAKKAVADETKDETKEKSAEETKDETKDTKKSSSELEALKSMVSEGFSIMTKFMEKYHKDSDTKEETKEKAQKEDSETKEKAQDTDTETKEKAEDTKEDKDDDTYAIKSALKKMQDISKAMDGETEEKAVGDEKDETTEKSIATIDQLALTMAATLEKMAEKLKQTGKSVPGFEKHIAEKIKSDPEMQKLIGEMMKEPGFKKSVSLGVPYMTTKDGKRYALSAKEIGEEKVEKSEKPRTFKEVYKNEFSSESEKGSE
jgi:phage head maturation protease